MTNIIGDDKGKDKDNDNDKDKLAIHQLGQPDQIWDQDNQIHQQFWC